MLSRPVLGALPASSSIVLDTALGVRNPLPRSAAEETEVSTLTKVEQLVGGRAGI